MTELLHLLDRASRDDLRVFLERLARAGRPEARLVTKGRVLAVFGCTQAPVGLMDPLPVVLVLRSFALAEDPASPIDTTVTGRSLLDRIARMARMGVPDLALELPEAVVTAAWAGVLPPSAGWQPEAAIDAPSLAAVAAQGIERVAQALPEDPGEAVVRQLRAAVWGAEVAPGVPAAAAFAAEAMGFLRDERTVRLARSRSWMRLDTSRGQVLVRG